MLVRCNFHFIAMLITYGQDKRGESLFQVLGSPLEALVHRTMICVPCMTYCGEDRKEEVAEEDRSHVETVSGGGSNRRPAVRA